jgi:rSAM/selenodomain-associated transferase 2
MRTLQEPLSLSAIIPTLNTADLLPAALAALGPRPAEIIVSDGGSTDDTASIARTAGALVVSAPRGRGSQLAAGAEAASADWLLFLHADCRLGSGWDAAVRAFIAVPGAVGRAGYFAFALDDTSPAARRLERVVRWRCRLLALPYGDQGLLIARSLYDEIGGFAAIPLMEDVDLVRRLGRRRLMPIPVPLYSSARRYLAEGYVRRPVRNLFCLALYFAGLKPRHIARIYG